MPVRTTIYLDDNLALRLQNVVPPRGLNRFVNEVLAQKIAEIERQAIEQAMKEGYIAAAREHDELSRDWEVVDLEGWPE